MDEDATVGATEPSAEEIEAEHLAEHDAEGSGEPNEGIEVPLGERGELVVEDEDDEPPAGAVEDATGWNGPVPAAEGTPPE